MVDNSMAIEELKQLQDDMLYTEKGHFAAAQAYGRTHLLLGLLATGASAISGATIISSLSKTAAGLLALLAALAAGLVTFLKPDQTAQRHTAAGQQLGTLRVEARQIMRLDVSHTDPTDVREKIRNIAARKSKIDATAPQVSDAAFKRARSKIKEGLFERDHDSVGDS